MGGGAGGGDSQTTKLLQEQQEELKQKKLKLANEEVENLRTGLTNGIFGSGSTTPIQDIGGRPITNVSKTE